ncbi:zinc transporter ZntB [Celerinatantimonas sp. YJH-8]|uniref:zinc transporter ZntB n=1 Tax=Celerinatantimonas sp. YJH-8 TaxID=3228714 RepID=UPI0038C70BAE
MDEPFISALLLDGQGRATTLSLSEVEQWFPEQGVLWVHLDCANEAGCQWLTERSGVSDVISEALLSEDTRPRISHIDEQSLVFLRGVNLAEGAEPEDMVSIRICIEQRRVISTRRRRLLSVADLIQALQEGDGPRTSSEFLVTLCHYLTLRMDAVIDDLQERMAQIEESVVEDASAEGRNELTAIRRQSIKLRRYLAPQREALVKIAFDRRSWLDPDDRPLLQESTDRLIRYIEELDAIRERAIVTQEEFTSQLSEQMNQRMYVMSLIAALFLPLGFLTGLLGVNIGGIPGTGSPFAFTLFVVFLLGISVLILIFFKIKRWF